MTPHLGRGRALNPGLVAQQPMEVHQQEDQRLVAATSLPLSPRSEPAALPLRQGRWPDPDRRQQESGAAGVTPERARPCADSSPESRCR